MEEIIWGNILPILVLVIAFLQMVFVHELGHFLMLKLCKVPVTAFSLGLPLTIPWRREGKWTVRIPCLRRKFGETEYILNFLPLGGYCQPKNDGTAGSFDLSPLRVRVPVLAAGVMMNLIAAALIFGWSFPNLGSVSSPQTTLESLPQAAVSGVRITAELTTATVASLADVKTYQNLDNFGSVVQIAQMTTQVTNCAQRSGDWNRVLQIFGILNISLAVINGLIPIPGLDGGTILMLLILGLLGKSERFKISPFGRPETESAIIVTGFGIIILLTLFLVVKDIIFPVKMVFC